VGSPPGTEVAHAATGDCGKRVLHDGDVDALLDFAHNALAARTAHRRTGNSAPLFVTLGAGRIRSSDSAR
jgi:hypothetical protein